MQFTTNIADHRPVYKRIDLGAKKAEPPAITITESEASRKLREYERDRLWRTIQQAAQGGVAPAETKPGSDPVAGADGVDLDYYGLFCFAKRGGPIIEGTF